MFPPAVARALRDRGHDVVAVAETSGLRTREDADILDAAVAQGRAVVTENVRDFMRLDAAVREQGGTHTGLVFILKAGLPTSGGRLVGALTLLLDACLASTEAIAAQPGFIAWPSPPEQ